MLRFLRSMTVEVLTEPVVSPLRASTRKVSSSPQQLSLSKQIFKRYCQPLTTWSGVRISWPRMSNFLTFLETFFLFVDPEEPMEWSDSSEDDEELEEDEDEESEDKDVASSNLLRMEAV